jgi:hypothetical protein|tara:strand:- start:2577 stop:2810 length:234 start_codon:yes stop_codon:yes gene_type:complete
MTNGNSNSETVVNHAAKFLKDFLKNKEIDKNTRMIIGRVVDFELRNLARSNRGLQQKIYEIVDGVARYNQIQEDQEG